MPPKRKKRAKKSIFKSLLKAGKTIVKRGQAYDRRLEKEYAGSFLAPKRRKR